MKKHYEILYSKAISDIKVAEVLIRSFKNNELVEEIGFHIEQAVEKLLKTLLSLNKIDFPKIHDIEKLISLSKEHNIKLPDYIDEFEALTMFAVDFRYDFIENESVDIKYYLDRVKEFIEWVRLNYII